MRARCLELECENAEQATALAALAAENIALSAANDAANGDLRRRNALVAREHAAMLGREYRRRQLEAL
jgi:hypothetical protein